MSKSPRSKTFTTYTPHNAAVILEKDRDTIARALRGIEPDQRIAKTRRYRMRTIVNALISGAAAASGSGVTAEYSKNAKEFSREKTLKLRASREQAQFELGRSRGEFVRIEEVGVALEQNLTIVRENLLALPPLVADEVARITRAAVSHETARSLAHDLIREKLYDILNAISDGSDSEDELRHAAIAKHLDKGSPPLQPTEIIVLDKLFLAEKTAAGWVPFDGVDGVGSKYNINGKNGALQIQLKAGAK